MSIKIDSLTNFKGSLAALKNIVDMLIKLHGDDTEIISHTITDDKIEFYIKEEGDL